MKFRSIILLLFAVLLAAASVGCAETDLSGNDEKVKIKVIVKKRSYDYWNVVKIGAEAAGKEFNVDVDFDGPVDEKDIDVQIAMVKKAVDDDVDALVLAASDFTLLVPAAEKAVASGIPVIIIDSNIKSNKMDSFIGTDNVDAGRKVGESLVEVMGESCDIAVMSFVKGAATAVEREEGFFEETRKYPGINVIDTLYCNSDEDIAQQLAIDMMKKNPDLDAFVCLNAYGTAGVARGVDESGKGGSIKVVGFDSTPEEIMYMENGVIQSLVIQNPFNMGYLGVKYALDAVNNVHVPKTVDTGATVINKENMYLPENQKLLFPFTD